MQDGEAHSNPFKVSHFQAECVYGCSELNKDKPCPIFGYFQKVFVYSPK